jgi:hypothetical protein
MDRTARPTDSPERGAPGEQTNAAGAGPTQTVPAHGSGYGTLKAFLAENASLIFMVGSLTSLSTFFVNLDLGWLDTYLKAVLLAAAGIVWFEFHAQWPDEMRLDRRGHVRPTGGVWRLVAFSYLMQITVVLIAIWSVAQAPEVVVPLLVVGLVVLLWQRLSRRRNLHPWLLPVMVAVAFLGSEFALARLFPHTTTLLDLVASDLRRDAEMVLPDA